MGPSHRVLQALKSFNLCGGYMLNWTSLVAQTVKNLPAMQETRFDFWVRKIPWRREWYPLQYSCLGNPMDRGASRTTVHSITKTRTY